ncbi:hypothetical protein AAMO2058_000908900 [Amorphochlora amoebiformis]
MAIGWLLIRLGQGGQGGVCMRRGYQCIREGEASIYFPEGERHNVFYNPAQCFNRDISIAAARAFYSLRVNRTLSHRKRRNNTAKPTLRILDALSASGLRALRYSLELGSDIIHHVTANDIDPNASRAISENLRRNRIPESRVSISNTDVRHLLNGGEGQRFDVIDLDPYGSAIEFLDSAVQAIEEDGMIMVTCTDSSVLCGRYPETCMGRYASVGLTAPYMHEMALRILLNSISKACGRYRKVSVPLLSLSVDFYVRVFVRIHTSRLAVKRMAAATGLVLQCVRCPYFKVVPMVRGESKYTAGRIEASVCEICGGMQFKMGGPIYTGPLHHREFVQEVLKIASNDTLSQSLATRKRIMGVLSVVLSELNQTVMFYSHPQLASFFKLKVVPKMEVVRGVLRQLGFNVSLSHTCPDSYKTDAPARVLATIFKEWRRRETVCPNLNLPETPRSLP